MLVARDALCFYRTTHSINAKSFGVTFSALVLRDHLLTYASKKVSVLSGVSQFYPGHLGEVSRICRGGYCHTPVRS